MPSRDGEWTVSSEASTSETSGGRIGFRFVARDVNIVMGPERAGSAVPFRVTLDGAPPGDAHGTDAQADGSGGLVEQRMYQMIRQAGTITDRLFEIEFLEPGPRASRSRSADRLSLPRRATQLRAQRSLIRLYRPSSATHSLSRGRCSA